MKVVAHFHLPKSSYEQVHLEGVLVQLFNYQLQIYEM